MTNALIISFQKDSYFPWSYNFKHKKTLIYCKYTKISFLTKIELGGNIFFCK